MFRVLSDHSGHSRLQFRWNQDSEHLRVVMGEKEAPLNTWDFYQMKQGIMQMTDIFERPARPSCQFTVYEIDGSGIETEVQAPQWVAFDKENRVRVLKKETVMDGLKGTLVTLKAERSLQEDCIYYTIQNGLPYKYPIPVPNCTGFCFFVGAAAPHQLHISAVEERPDILIQGK